MDGKERWDDDRLAAELAAALAPPDVPASILQAARAVYTWRTLDAQLAALAYDSSMSGESLVGVRGSSAPPRSLAFEAPGISLEVDITRDSLVGQVLPAEAGTLEVRPVWGADTRVPVDGTGAFRVHPLPRTAFRLIYTSERGHRLITDQVQP